jgi:hypothetical protein
MLKPTLKKRFTRADSTSENKEVSEKRAGQSDIKVGDASSIYYQTGTTVIDRITVRHTARNNRYLQEIAV